jgi:oxygen-independent coproporphyrinogen-3 oxidase
MSRSAPVEHLYVHLPFCAHRCGYCDFVTAVGRQDQHADYVTAVLAELELERSRLAAELATVFVGGGTPTFTEPAALARLLAGLPGAPEVTVEANPETVTPALAAMLRSAGVTRVSLGAQSFRPHVLAVLERRATPDDVRRAVHHLRDVSFDNISLDLLYGVPGQSAADLDHDLAEAIALRPEHLSWYELEAKPGTRFAHAHGADLVSQAEALEEFFERVVERLTGAGYRWYETANFCRVSAAVDSRDLRAQHNLAYWLGRDYVGLGVGAVSTVDGVRWRNGASVGAYVEQLRRGVPPARTIEELDPATRQRERLMLGLRLDEPLFLAADDGAVDGVALGRLEDAGLVEVVVSRADGRRLRLTRRGRFLGGAVTADLLA